MRTICAVLLPVAALTTSIACGSTSSETYVGPSPVRCAVSATPTPASFPASGGSGTLKVAAARECAWSASSQAEWVTLEPPTEGQGDGNVQYRVAANPAAAARRGTLVLGSQSTEIMQEPAPCRFELDRRSFELPAEETTAAVEVSAPAGCAWTAKPNVPWIAIVEGKEGTGPGPLRFRVSANPDAQPRSGSLEVAGVRVEVRQVGGVLPCRYEVEPQAVDAGPQAEEGSVAVRTDADCAWTAASDADWLAVVAGERGSGPGDVRYQTTVNASGLSRTGRITLNEAVFTLTQAPCTYAIDPASRSFTAAGGKGSVSVQTEAGCPWSAESANGWIDITSAASRTGAARITYQVNPNILLSTRTGTILVAGQTFTVSQDGAISLSGRARSVEGACPDRRFTVNGQRVRTSAATDYEGGSCGDIQEGAALRLKGILGTDGVLAAFEVDF